MAQEGGRRGQGRRRHRRDRDRQGDDGIRGGGRGDDRQDPGARGHRRTSPSTQPIAVLLEEGEDKSAIKDAPAAAPPADRIRPKAASEAPATPASPAAAAAAPAVRRSRPRRRKPSRSHAPPARRLPPTAARRPRLRLAARPASGQGSRHRPRAGQGHRPAWPRGQVRHRGGTERRHGGRGACRLPAAAKAPVVGAVHDRRADHEAVRGGRVRGRPARQRAQDHRPAAGRGEDHHPAFLPDRRHRDRRAAGARASRSTPPRRATRTATPPTRSRSTTSSSRRWPWR